jgi:transaldolase
MGVAQSPAEGGMSFWLDGLEHDHLANGDFARLVVDRRITGATTTAATWRAAAAHGAVSLGGGGRDQSGRDDAAEALRGLVAADVRQACGHLRAVFDATGGCDGYASIDVDPRCADDAVGTLADAQRLVRLVDRPNLLVSLPATPHGLEALTGCLAEGIGVNVTMIFGLRRYAGVVDAYMDGLERLRLAGGNLSSVTSVASVVVSPVTAGARPVRALYGQSLMLPRWLALDSAGARPQRLLWSPPTAKGPPLRVSARVHALAFRDVVMAVSRSELKELARDDAFQAGWLNQEPGGLELADGATADVGGQESDLELERNAVRSRTAAWRSAVATVGR